MNTPETEMTPEAAAAALASAARTPRPASPRDRRVYAVGTALSGIFLGGYLAFIQAIDRTNGWYEPSVLFYVVLISSVAIWQRRAARAIPLGAKRIGWIGLALTIPFLFGALLIARLVHGQGPLPWPIAVGFGLAVAAPLVIAAYRIDVSGRE